MNTTTTTTTTTKPKAAKTPTMKPNQAHPFALSLQCLSADAKDLAAAVAAQTSRNAALAQSRDNEAATLAAVAAEEISYKTGAAKLAEVRGEIDATEHAIRIRAQELVASANHVLSNALDLKQSTIAALYNAAGFLAARRQGEVAARLKVWGGGAPEASDPLPLWIVATACYETDGMEELAADLSAWTPSQGLKALVAALQPAVNTLVEINAPAPPKAIHGGFVEHQRAAVVGWRDSELQKVTIFEGPVTAARQIYAEIQGRPGFLDFARVELFLANSDHTTVFQNHNGKARDGRDISAMQTGEDHDGRSHGFLTKTAAWLA